MQFEKNVPSGNGVILLVKDIVKRQEERVFIPGRCGKQRRRDRKVRKRIEKDKSSNGKRNSIRTCREVVRGNRRRNEEKSVVVDVVARTLMTSTDTEPMTQRSESALGYSVSGTYLVPGGGLFIKKSELARLGLKRQRIGVIDLYDDDKRDHSNAL